VLIGLKLLKGSEMKKVTLAQARKDLSAYIKLAEKDSAMWKKQTAIHTKELLRLCEIYMNLKERKRND